MEPTNDQPLKTKHNGPMDKVVKEKANNPNGESSQPPDLHPVAEPSDKPETSGCTPPLAKIKQESAYAPCDPVDKQEEEPHETHSFQWCWRQNKPTTTACNKAGTVEDVLKRSPQFNVIARKNKNKELVIVRDGKAISSLFPCSLIKNECLTIKYVKAADKPKPDGEAVGNLKQPVSGSVHRQRKRQSSELVTFHLLTRGGDNVVRILRNTAMRDFTDITVFAYKGEKVKQALRRDGRLLDTVFKKNCALSDKITESTTEMSSLVDDLDGKTFKIILLDKSDPPNSQPGSLDDAFMMQTESQRSDSDGNQDPQQQSSTTESVDDSRPKRKPKLDDNKAPEKMFREIPDSTEVKNYLSSLIKKLVKGMNVQQAPKLSRIQNLFRVEYGKNDQTCRDVKTMKKLMDLSDSVCQVRINDQAIGTGFLLFGNFVLTNQHVVKDICNVDAAQLNKRVTAHFSFESLNQLAPGAVVEEVAGFEYGCDESGHRYDWALLKLAVDQKLPDVLLTRFGFLPQSGGICIIGHPHGGVKQIDPCLIIPTEDRIEVVERHHFQNPNGIKPFNPDFWKDGESIQMVTHRFFEDASKNEMDRRALNYETCFSFGSSGSPVFDDHCNVVAMHSGGYPYRNVRGETVSVIEYGYRLSDIMEHIIVQMVTTRKFDVLKEYLACKYEHEQNMKTNLKKLVESRNLSAFKYAASKPEVLSDESLKTFFDFFSQREEPELMDSNGSNCT